MPSDIAPGRPQSTSSSPPVQPSPPRRSSALKFVVMAIVVIIVVAAVVVVVALPHTHTITVQPASQPTFTFLSASNLTSVYGFAMTATNATKNLSSYIPPGISYPEIVKAEMWLYQPFETSPIVNASSLLIVGTIIMELNSSRMVNQSLGDFIQAGHTQANTTVSQGNMSGFHYVLVSQTVSSVPVDIYFATHGKFILFVEFIGSSAVAKAPTVFTQQVGTMLQPAKA